MTAAFGSGSGFAFGDLGAEVTVSPALVAAFPARTGLDAGGLGDCRAEDEVSSKFGAGISVEAGMVAACGGERKEGDGGVDVVSAAVEVESMPPLDSGITTWTPAL